MTTNIPIINEEIINSCVGMKTVWMPPKENDTYFWPLTEMVCKTNDGVKIYGLPLSTDEPRMEYIRKNGPVEWMPRDDDKTFLQSIKDNGEYTSIDKVGDLEAFTAVYLRSTMHDPNAISTFYDPTLTNSETFDKSLAGAAEKLIEEIKRENSTIDGPKLSTYGISKAVKKQASKLAELNQGHKI